MGDTGFDAPGLWRTGSNVRFIQGRPQSLGGSRTLSADTYSTPRNMMVYKIGALTYLAVACFAAGSGKLYKSELGVWTPADITPASFGTILTTTRFSLDMFGDILLVAPGNGTLYSSTSGAQAVSIAAAPDNITKMIVTPSRQVMAMGCNEEVSGTFNGRCIRWSDIEDHTDWTTTSSNNAGEYILPGQENIVGGCLVGNYIAIWTNGSLWLGEYVGDPGQTFVFTRIDSVGLHSVDAWAVMHGVVYWMDPNLRLYAYAPGTLPQRIPNPVYEDFAAELRPDFDAELRAVAHSKFSEIWFFYYSQSDSASKYIAYSVDESRNAERPVWFTGTLDCGAVVDSPLIANLGATGMGDSTVIIAKRGATATLSGFDQQQANASATIPAGSIQSSLYYLDGEERRVQLQRYINDMGGGSGLTITVTVSSRRYPEDSTTTSSFSVTGSTNRYDFRHSGQMFDVKFEWSATANSTPARIGKCAFELVSMGQR